MTRKEYLLNLLGEECSEVAQRVSKAIRFGLDEIQPGQSKNNKERLIEELVDLIVVVGKLQNEGILPIDGEDVSWVDQHGEDKEKKIEKYIEYSTTLGIING